jgi:hypothetical protein
LTGAASRASISFSANTASPSGVRTPWTSMRRVPDRDALVRN